MNSVFLLKARPAVKLDKEVLLHSIPDRILLAIYEDEDMAKEEIEKFKEKGNWEDFQIEQWEVRKKYDWAPVPSPYSFRNPSELFQPDFPYSNFYFLNNIEPDDAVKERVYYYGNNEENYVILNQFRGRIE